MHLPIDNWQFWATTVLLAGALAWLLRSVLPIPGLRRRRSRRKRERRVNLTVGGKSPR